MQARLRRVAASVTSLGVVVVLAGCSVGPRATAGSSPEPSAGAGGTAPVPTATPTPTLAPTATPATPAPSLAAVDLEELLPDFIGSAHVTKRSVPTAELVDGSGSDVSARLFGRVIDDLDLDLDAIEAASGTASFISLVALRAAGTDPADLAQAFVDAILLERPDATVDPVDVDGHAVRRVRWAGTEQWFSGDIHLVVAGDALVTASGRAEDAALIERTIGDLFEPAFHLVLPAEIDGRLTTRQSGPGDAFATGGDVCFAVCPEEVPRMAEALGVDLDQVDVAVAALSGGNDLQVLITAFRFEGVGTERLMDARYLDEADPDRLRLERLTVAGRDVTWVGDAWFDPEGEGLELSFAHDGVLYVVKPAPRRFGDPITPIVEAAIAALG